MVFTMFYARIGQITSANPKFKINNFNIRTGHLKQMGRHINQRAMRPERNTAATPKPSTDRIGIILKTTSRPLIIGLVKLFNYFVR